MKLGYRDGNICINILMRIQYDMNRRKKIGFSIIWMMLVVLLTGCGDTNRDTEIRDTEQEQSYVEDAIPTYINKINGIEKLDDKIDYSNSDNWMFLPEENTKEVDTIYLYPSAYGLTDEVEDDIADIDDVNMRLMSIYYASSQASIFDESTNLYAPYYRQFTVNSLVDMIDKSPESLQYIASKDIYNMLDYYFENHNDGRPFILAGHSQGSVWLTIVLEDYMKAHPEYLERMVAAYIIGYSVTEEYLERNPHLKFAQTSEDTGVIISYNTEGPGNKDAFNCVVRDGAISINPINWKLDDTYATNGTVDAQIDTERGVVVCTTMENTPEMKEALAEYFGEESFHLFDYDLYKGELQKNVVDRIESFMKKEY